MSRLIEINTDRLHLRQWRATDREPFASINADPEVMEFFPSTLSRDASDSAVARWQLHIAEHGWGMWAAELLSTGQFIGFVGLQMTSERMPFDPCVEVGWRLARRYWGQGFASEAALAALRVGFEQLNLQEIVSAAPSINHRSRTVMERLGMQQTEATFQHPSIPEGSQLRECCLYRLTQANWRAQLSNNSFRPKPPRESA